MNIYEIDDRFLVCRKVRAYEYQYFSFFIDADKSSWTRFADQGAKYKTIAEAEDALEQIKQRARLRRKAEVHL